MIDCEPSGAPTVGEVLGRTAVALRGEHKLELVARATRLAGLNWGTGRIADLEAGRVSPTLPTLIAVCWAFTDLLGRRVELADLFAGEGNVTLAPGVVVPLEVVRHALKGELADPRAGLQLARLGFPVAGLDVDPSDMAAERVAASMLEADFRVARSVGIPAEQAGQHMETLWGRSFTAERDQRAGPDANAQKRGRISRQLKAELQEALNRGDD